MQNFRAASRSSISYTTVYEKYKQDGTGGYTYLLHCSGHDLEVYGNIAAENASFQRLDMSSNICFRGK